MANYRRQVATGDDTITCRDKEVAESNKAVQNWIQQRDSNQFCAVEPNKAGAEFGVEYWSNNSYSQEAPTFVCSWSEVHEC